MTMSNVHITNLNRTLKNIKSDVMANFIQFDIIITTNKVASPSNLHTIKNYIKNVNNMDSNNILTPQLSQSKSYLKIIDILYLI